MDEIDYLIAKTREKLRAEGITDFLDPRIGRIKKGWMRAVKKTNPPLPPRQKR